MKLVEHAFRDQWGATAQLVAYVPKIKVFIGDAPLLIEDETAEVLAPFVELWDSGAEAGKRTSDSKAAIGNWLLRITAIAYADAKELALEAWDKFDGITFTWDRGEVQDMRLMAQAEPREVDGLWKLQQTWRVRITLNAAS